MISLKEKEEANHGKGNNNRGREEEVLEEAYRGVDAKWEHPGRVLPAAQAKCEIIH
ncbi:MAG: hypothetical protein GXP46_05810, partial [Deferribacteres bacterium]|nr:hypothetical protein [Deferribacteres bacterium]